MSFEYHSVPSGRTGNEHPGPRSAPRFPRLTAALFLAAAATSCIIPMDTGANAAAIALEEVDNALYTMRDEAALLQVQIDSLSAELRKTDSLVRWVANLTGNPIVDPPTFYIPPP
jgi:hypothetical protein